MGWCGDGDGEIFGAVEAGDAVADQHPLYGIDADTDVGRHLWLRCPSTMGIP